MSRIKAVYTRVSSKGQSSDMQESVLPSFKEKLMSEKWQNYNDEGVSGTTPLSERKGGKSLLEDVRKGLISELYIYSIDRLGRDTVEILKNIQEFTKFGVCVISEKEHLRTLDKDGSENPMSKLMIGMLATIAEFEYNRARERRNDGIALAKAKKKYKGRKKGTSMTNEKVLKKYKKVVKCLESGNSFRDTAKLCEVSLSTVQRVSKVAYEEGVLE